MKTRNLGISRRQFIARATAITAGAALLGPRAAFSATCPADTLPRIGEIASSNRKLKAVIKVKNGLKVLPGYSGSQQPMMRYFEGYDQQAETPAVWPEDKTAINPGPTLRVKVGERVEITLLNQVDSGAFPAGTIDNAETGRTDGCDQATNATVDPPDKNWYPKTRGDKFPNCFHASSTMNLHFHGSHASPDGFADNVLVHVRPDPKITEKTVKPYFDAIFAACAKHDEHAPRWDDLAEPYRKWQKEAIRKDDLNALWKGKRGPVDGKSVLPVPNQLAPKNEDDVAAGLWPQYFSGAYPNCFKVTEGKGHVMGQAPGTHWYHAHKHGSTSINILNGLAGALIIEGDYDRDLEKIYPDLKKRERVMIVQTWEAINDLMLTAGFPGGKKATTTNGSPITLTAKDSAGNRLPQIAPVIVMRPGEIQLWRIVNAQVQNNIGPNASFYAQDGGTLPEWRQIAQDGVQFSRYNYNKQPLKTINATTGAAQLTLVAGGRIDLLVQAPTVEAGQTRTFEFPNLVNLVVCGDPVDDKFPDGEKGDYPEFPPFLADIGECRIKRTLSFDWEQFRFKPGPAAAGTAAKRTHCLRADEVKGCTEPPDTFPFLADTGGPAGKIKVNKDRAPYFMIDNEQFSDAKFYQTMILSDIEEWTITNNTNVPHPFHIHVNPFQVVEVFDPNSPGTNYINEEHGVWQDVVNVPSALKYGDDAGEEKGNVVLGKDGFAKTPGFVRIRSRFADFTGNFVLHCHILAHEDRGMMQLVRVIDGGTTIKHH